MLELREVSKRYGDRQALRPTSLVFPAGRTLALLGPSGCGKSTLLRILVGLTTPDGGEIRFAGEPLRRSGLQAYRRRIGYMIQEGGLFPHLTIAGNAELLARRVGWPRDRRRARLVELARLTRLDPETFDRYPSQLSGGQRQRAALIRSLFLDPDVLLLDEPMGALDPLVRNELQAELREIFRSLGKTVVLVTHDLGEAGFLADEIVLLRAGRIVQQGTLRALVEAPAEPFVTEFIRAQRSPLEALGEVRT